ncbi:CoA pyrophosphatase [Shewanella gelidii]|uniref:Coenzyme A pyrophosphatase n=1 Tax=Shewanella gelidii TaxID=1642821 RepID=A0A917JWG6_9GAMM|nr:CoA pyrophosphatase [Shewanella gelidii]MCL1098559.1 CoA pyrophosphatase [Shewanella gelidii]GGI87155.1 coenzyme A pyrophosphatase [Shewanella gelidii]
MEISELATRYQLHALSSPIPLAPPYRFASKTKLRQAAVLIPVIAKPDGLHIGLTQRPMHMRAHPGQISFPGGKVESSDINEAATALREAEEEIGLSQQNVTVLGQFPSHNTFTGFEITPIVGMVKQPFEPVLDPGEVADYFTVPLSFLRQQHNRHRLNVSRKGQNFPVFFIPYQNRFIWGATAAIIDLFCRHIFE